MTGTRFYAFCVHLSLNGGVLISSLLPDVMVWLGKNTCAAKNGKGAIPFS